MRECDLVTHLFKFVLLNLIVIKTIIIGWDTLIAFKLACQFRDILNRLSSIA
jgi:hypothetical protein